LRAYLSKHNLLAAMLHISDLIIYPIKSLKGISVQSAKVTERGLEHDRRWMLVDHNNRFISQREIPQMALCKPAITDEGLSVTYLPTGDNILIPYQPLSNELIEVTVWDDTCTGQYVSTNADAWFSRVLSIPCRLVYMPDDSRRMVDPRYTDGSKITSFSDAYPFLVIGKASLADLSKRVGQEIPIDRFRPNLVFAGGDAYMEDEMAHFTINHIHFYGAKLCARCPIPGIDQDTGISGKEPLKTMAAYRRKNNKVWLGQNLVHEGSGVLQVDDVIEVLEMKAAAVFD
jgi:uncharacterized protein YcbX